MSRSSCKLVTAARVGACLGVLSAPLNQVHQCYGDPPAAKASAGQAPAASTQPGNVETQDEIDFTGGPDVTFSVNTADGEQMGMRVYRSDTPGKYRLLGIPLPVKPNKQPKAGYPTFVYDALAPGEPRPDDPADAQLPTTHLLELRFQIHTPELLARAREEVLKSPTELKYLKDSGVDPKDVHVIAAPINAVVVELQYFGKTFSTARTQSILSQSRFPVRFELTGRQLQFFSDGVKDGRVAFRTHVRSKGQDGGWRWGEVHTKLVGQTAENSLLELKKSADRRGMKDVVLVNDYANATRDFAAQATIDIRTNDPTLLGVLQPDDFATVFAEAVRSMNVDDLRKDNLAFDAAIAEYLLPLIEQQLISQGRSDLTTDLKQKIKETTESAGGGFSLPFIGGDASSTTTETLIEGVQRTAGVKFQRDDLNKRFALTQVSVRKLRGSASFAEVRTNKSVLIQGGKANYWLTLNEVPVAFKADDLNAALNVAVVSQELRVLREGVHADALRRLESATQRVQAAEATRNEAVNAHESLAANVKGHEAQVAQHQNDAAQWSAKVEECRKIPLEERRVRSGGRDGFTEYVADSSKRDAAVNAASKHVTAATAKANDAEAQLKLARIEANAAAARRKDAESNLAAAERDREVASRAVEAAATQLKAESK